MSNTQQTLNNDKLEAVSTTVDSGFFSQELSSRDCSGLIEQELQDIQEQQEQIQAAPMRLDSGIDTLELSSQLFSVHLDSNDLNKCKSKDQLIIPSSSQPTKDIKSWEMYFEQDVNGDTCLHTAIMEGFLEACRILIKLSPHQMLLDTHNDEAQSPLHLAVLTRQWEVARWLIIAGARSNTRNLSGDSPLHIAARNGDINCCTAITRPVSRKEVEQLDLSYVPRHTTTLNLEQWNREGQTCLHVAALYDSLDVLSHLIKCGADVNAREGKAGYTVLHIAVETHNDLMIRQLMNCQQIDYESFTYAGRSALQLEPHALDAKLCEVLQSHGVPSYVSSEDEHDSESDSDDLGDEVMMIESQF